MTEILKEKNKTENLPEGWKRVRLGEVILENPKSPFNVENANTNGKYPFFTSGEKILKSDIYLVDGENIFIGDGGTSSIFYYYGKASYSNHVYSITTKRDIINKLLFFILRNNKEKIVNSFFSGTGLKNLNKNLLKQRFFIIFPENIKEQQKIAEILETVDNAIERTEKIIEKYKRIKQGLMQDLLTKGIDENGKIRDEKTHKFKNSPLGKIPEEWEVVRLGEVAKLERGKFQHRPRNDPKLYGGKIPFIQTGDISNSNKYVRHFKQTLNEKGLRVSKLFKKGDLVITIAANIGDTAILSINAAFPDSVVAVIKEKSIIDLEYLHYLFNDLKIYLNSIAIESAQKNVNLAILNNILIKFPPLPEQKRIASVLSQIDETIEKETAYKEKLQHLKKGLMEDLLTGKVRVKI